jgi:hypothetical protein
MKLLEERGNTLLLINDDGQVELVKSDPCTLLRCKYFQGKRVRLPMVDGENTGSIEEMECDDKDDDEVANQKFLCALNGQTLEIDDACAISEAARSYIETGNMKQYVSIFRFYTTLKMLDIKVQHAIDSRAMQLDRDGTLHIPSDVTFSFTELQIYRDGSTVAKAVFRKNPSANHDSYGVFRESRTGVALIGLDDAGQHWMHFLPPAYETKSLQECELWLVGGKEGDEIVVG